MRNCPECQTEMVPTKKTFAMIDVCPQCGGTFLDAGEGAAAFGPEAEMRFLLDDGRAHRIGHSRRTCPTGHGPMTTFGVRTAAAKAVEIDFCEECGGFFFDAGEGEALAAIEVAPPGTFVMPPPLSNQEEVIRDARQSGPSFFARFVTDFVSRRRVR
jgi:Zn-finger nucleic acid-binding protein